MFKYIAKILSTLSVPQRLLALIILVLTVVIITIAPLMIDAVTYDGTELKGLVANQKTEISLLRSELDSLNDAMVNSQKECTNKAVQREKEILAMVESIEASVKSSSPEPVRMMMVRRDSGNVSKSMVEEKPQVNLRNYEVMSQINDLKKNISTNIELK